MEFVPYLSFDGRCREAFAFYADVLGGEIRQMTSHGETPAREHVPADWAGAIINATLEVDGRLIMGADTPPAIYREPVGNTVNILLREDETDRARRIFDALAQGGSIVMPFAPTFWARGFGLCVDRYGISWMVNCTIPC